MKLRRRKARNRLPIQRDLLDRLDDRGFVLIRLGVERFAKAQVVQQGGLNGKSARMIGAVAADTDRAQHQALVIAKRIFHSRSPKLRSFVQ